MAIDLKELLGEKFRDDLTLDEVSKFLFEDESYVTKAELQAEQDKSNKYAKEAGEYRKQLNANKSAEEIAKQQQEEEMNKLIEQNRELEKKLSVMENEKRFITLGYDEALAHKTAVALAEGDMKTFFKNQETFNDEQRKRMENQALKDTPVPEKADTKKEDVMTKDRLSKMSLREQAEYAKKNPQEYQNLYKGE